jgi:hypothetical protein
MKQKDTELHYSKSFHCIDILSFMDYEQIKTVVATAFDIGTGRVGKVGNACKPDAVVVATVELQFLSFFESYWNFIKHKNNRQFL